VSTDRAVRSLTALRNASSGRVLNLCSLHAGKDGDEDFRARPFFLSPIFNTSILLKHRLRFDEVELFRDSRTVATKVIVPFDRHNLRLGGQSFFIGQDGFEELVREVGNYKTPLDCDRDLALMDLIDQTPSLDPFMLRQKLATHGIAPHADYFAISAADRQQIHSHAVRELKRLIQLAAGAAPDSATSTGRMVSALLSNEVDEKLAPLRLTLGMTPDEFAEGVFSWRGFIYYKWCIQEAWQILAETLREMRAIQPVGTPTPDEKAFLQESKREVTKTIRTIVKDITKVLAIYDGAYGALVDERRPEMFRQFLEHAPTAFIELGEKLGAIQHITTFWRYRFPRGVRRTIGVVELGEVFEDFLHGLGTSVDSRMVTSRAA
jgi:hypothetical protein